jgi:isocitrate dehydrogenase kinase/phosphatase
MAWILAKQIAQAILRGFERHYCLFREITAGAKQRFERADWQSVQESSRERIYYYDQRVLETLSHLQRTFRITDLDEVLWQRVKVEYVRLLNQHKQAELAETFYNSVFCHMFHRKYFNNRNIFVRPAVSTDYIDTDVPTYRSYYPAQDGFDRVAGRILDDMGFDLPFADRRRDVRNILRAIREFVPANFYTYQSFHLAVLSFPFYRNKAAYIIGKVVNGPEETPFALPVLNDEAGGLYVDTLLVGEGEIANVFSFARAYFMVDTDAPSAVVNFLLRLLPSKSRADLYTYIGLHKQGKTEFYRDFLHHLRHSGDRFVTAPGIKGMVMTVFTLPSFPYVFKVIKDRFRAPKDLTREVVKEKYQLVKNHDRVGRMADSWEYSEAAFPIERFSDALLEELRSDASDNIEIEGEQIIIKHLYIERRMVPLNVYLENADEDQLRAAIDEYGQAIKQLAAANIFPGDLLFKNFGVTRQGRVVFYDYDEICYLTECSFRELPAPPLPEYELSDEPWYPVGPNDIFPEEFERFLLTDPRVKKVFMELHSDLLDCEYWRTRQKKILAGQMEDVFPYREWQRFENRYPDREIEAETPLEMSSRVAH